MISILAVHGQERKRSLRLAGVERRHGKRSGLNRRVPYGPMHLRPDLPELVVGLNEARAVAIEQ